jgi:hypothetical protein
MKAALSVGGPTGPPGLPEFTTPVAPWRPVSDKVTGHRCEARILPGTDQTCDAAVPSDSSVISIASASTASRSRGLLPVELSVGEMRPLGRPRR